MPFAARLSIGAKLALRYTAAVAVTVTAIALFVYAQVAHRINREAKLVLEVQTHDLLEAYRNQLEASDPDQAHTWMKARIQQLVRSSDPSLDLGIEWIGEDGESLVRAGSLAKRGVPLSRALLEGRKDSQLRAINLGKELAYLSMSVRAPTGFVQLAMNTERYADNVRHIRDVFLLSLPLVLFLTAIAGWFLARGSLHPISQITRTARRIHGANLDETVPVTGSKDELDQLAETFNEMLLRLQGSMGRLRRFNANVAHELRTPLTAISSQVEVTLEHERASDEYKKVLEAVDEQLHVLAQGVDAMLRLARSEAGLDPEHRVETAIDPILTTVHDFFSPLAADHQLEFVVENRSDAIVMGDASWLHQLFSNLIANAIKYTPPGGRIALHSLVEEGWLKVSVSDTGQGIPEEALERVFERYQRMGAREREHGFGLGLPIAQEIARAHGGRIELLSRLGAGSTFTVWLPIRADS